MGFFEDLKKLFEAQEPFNKVLRPELKECVKIYEDCVNYPADIMVAMHEKEAELHAIKDVEELKERLPELTRLRKKAQVLRAEKPQEKIMLWPAGKMPVDPQTGYTDNSSVQYTHDPDFEPFMHSLLLPEGTEPKGAIILCAGGDHGSNILLECYQAGLEMNELGYQCFILLNRPNGNPWSGKEAGADVARAVQYLRANAAKYRTEGKIIAFAGFSNGGLTGEQNIQYFSGTRGIKDSFPDYQPDELDQYYGCPDAFLCVYGPRFADMDFDWNGAAYPPTIVIVGEEDFNISNVAAYAQDLRSHGVKVEMHTFINCPHGGVGNAILGHVEHPNYYQWRTLCDNFLAELARKS